MRSLFASAAVLLSFFAIGCDTAGVNPLAARRDTVVACTGQTTTWIRSTDTATEILLLGSADPLTVVAPTSPSCFGYGYVEHDSTTHFEFGSYDLDAKGTGHAAHSAEYDFVYQPDRAILKRDGSTRTTLAPPITESLVIARDGTKIVVTLGGERMVFHALGEVIDSIDPTTMDGATQIFRIFNLPLFTSQARLLGFGSGRMTQYAGTTATFVGTIQNRFTVNVESPLKPNTNITYYQFEDLTGVVIDGLQQSLVNTSGAGTMKGVLAFVMLGAGGPGDVALRGTLDYGKLTISNGVAGGGTYALAIQGVPTPFTIPYTVATDIDLRGILPVDP